MKSVPETFATLPVSIFADDVVSVRPVGAADIEEIRVWRNSQMSVLRQKREITQEQQRAYFESRVWPEMGSSTPREVLFAIEQSRTMVGYGGLVHISWEDNRAEISFLLDPRIESNSHRKWLIFSHFLSLVAEVAFSSLKLEKLFTETFSFRTEHIAVIEKAGFQLEGALRSHVKIGSTRYDSVLHGLLAKEWEKT